MKADALKQLAVVSIENGTKLGYIDDLLFDPVQYALAGLWVKADDQHHLIPIADVHSIGSDAVTVPRDDVLRSAPAASELAALPGLEQLHKLKVVNEAGTYLGTVRELELDLTSYRLSSLTAHEGGLLGLGGTTTTVAVDAIRSMGAELIVVATAADTAQR